MKIERLHLTKSNGQNIPAAAIEPQKPVGSVVLVHGYGGCKEEMLGMGWRIAEQGHRVITIDLEGHGENLQPFDEGICDDIEAAISYCRPYGKVVAIGHSLGGRLSLTSSADFAIGISPAISDSFGEKTFGILKTMRGYRVKDNSENTLPSVMNNIPAWKPNKNRKSLIIFGSRDVPEIIDTCRSLETDKIEISNAFHADIFTLEPTIIAVLNQIKIWFAC